MFPAPMEDEYRGGESATDWDIGGNFPGFTGWGGWGSSLGQRQKQRPDGRIASLPSLDELRGMRLGL